MTRRSRFIPALALAGSAAFVLSACDVEPDDAGEIQIDTMTQEESALAPGDQSDWQAGEVYEARLEAVDGSGASGVATVTVQDDELQVTIAATGLDPETRYPVHIHMNASCDDAGGILLNLDDGLTVAGEGEPRGDSYAQTDDQGHLEYEASRSMDDLRAAMQEHGAEQADSLDLANRVVNLHSPEMQPVACGPLDQTGQGQAGAVSDTGQTPRP